MSAEYTCIRDEQIQAQSRKIERLEARADYEYKRIDEMNEKLDKLLDGFNKLQLESTQDDNALNNRLTAIETELELQKLQNARRTTWIGVCLTVLTILINIYFNIIN